MFLARFEFNLVEISISFSLRNPSVNLFRIIHFITKAFHSQSPVEIIFTDFSKAFDELDDTIKHKENKNLSFLMNTCVFILKAI